MPPAEERKEVAGRYGRRRHRRGWIINPMKDNHTRTLLPRRHTCAQACENNTRLFKPVTDQRTSKEKPKEKKKTQTPD